MANWACQVRVPGPGGAWTDCGLFQDLWYRLEVNSMPQVNFSIPNPSASLANLLVIGNEIRILDPNSVEKVRGMIREATNDPILKIQKIIAVGKAVRLQDRVWRSRRSFPTVSPSVVFDELMNSPEGEPSAGLLLRYDMETLNSNGLVSDLGVFGNNATITTATQQTGKWGNGYHFNVSTDILTINNPTSQLTLTYPFTITFWLSMDSNTASTQINAINRSTGTITGNTFAGWKVLVSQGVAGNYSATLCVGTGAGAQTFISSPGLNFSAGTKIFFAFTANGTTGVGYTNTSSQSNPLTQAFSNPGTTITFGSISAGDTVFGAFGAGIVDELHVYNRVLTAAELNQLRGQGVLEGGVGTVDASLPTAPPRIEGDRRLQVIDSYTRALGAEWYVDQNGSDQDRLNVVSRVGSSTSTQTFQLSKNCSLGNRQLNNDTIFNDIICFGVGDGFGQLQSRNFSATTVRTTLTSNITSSQTTGFTVTSTSGFSTNGVVYVGMERIQYTGISGSTIGSTSIVRGYQGDGISSYPGYAHNIGMEVYQSFDGTNYWTSSNAQANSQISLNGLRNGVYTDKTITDQNTIDFLAYNLNIRYNNPRESLQISFPSNTITAVLGDAVTVNDSSGNPYSSTPYRIIAMEWDWDSKTFKLELLPNSTPHASGGFIDTPSRRQQASSESISDFESYGVVGDISIATFAQPNPQTITTTTETVVQTIMVSGVKAATKIILFGFINATSGTAATGSTIRFRRGSTTAGTQVTVNPFNQSNGASAGMNIMVSCTDIALTDNPTYCLTYQQGGATGNASVWMALIWVENSN